MGLFLVGRVSMHSVAWFDCDFSTLLACELKFNMTKAPRHPARTYWRAVEKIDQVGPRLNLALCDNEAIKGTLMHDASCLPTNHSRVPAVPSRTSSAITLLCC
jgi:hypothetical protein